ncbi:MAG TPA: hypothetical protein VFK57_16330 [Vicinamibacterales bacterium]|nr:hypothetical protein [Vicinamibacterales bacterium]
MHTHDLTTIDTAGLGALQRRGLIVGAVGLVLGAVGVVLHPADFLPSWLIGFLFFTGLSLGCLALLMLQHMTGGQWGMVGRRVFEAGSRMLPLAALFCVPIVVFAPKLFLWARPEAVQADPILQAKAPYLNVPFFTVRAVIYFAVFLGLAYFLNKWSAEQDRGAVAQTDADTRRFRVVSAPGLLIYVLLMSLAAVDWIMSLDPHWYSTIFGLTIVVGQGLSALSFTVAVLALLVGREPMNGVLKARHFHDFGKLMLALVMLWAYFSFSQFLIIWAGNLPEEIPYYLERLRHGWQYLSVALVFGHFILPFCLLLSQDLKKRPKLLSRIAWFIVAIRLYDLIWLVAPTFHREEALFPISLANVGVPLALGGLWVYLVAGQLQKRPMLPVNDPHFKDMLLHGNQGGH